MNLNNKYFKKLASVYDRKIQSGINKELAAGDLLSFNHSGIVLPSSETNVRPATEKSLLQKLHAMEKELVSYSISYLGKASRNTLMLDAGCGGGGSAIMISKKMKFRVIGCTLSKKQAAYGNNSAQKYRVADRVKFFQGNMLDTPAQKEDFDLIWACESTEHIPEKNLSLMFKEFSRLTKPKSRLVIIAWTSMAGVHKDGKRIKTRLDKHYLTDIHTAQLYTSTAKKNGWKLLRKVNLAKNSLPYWRLRKQSNNATGSEDFFIEGYTNNSLAYFLYVFERDR